MFLLASRPLTQKCCRRFFTSGLIVRNSKLPLTNLSSKSKGQAEGTTRQSTSQAQRRPDIYTSLASISQNIMSDKLDIPTKNNSLNSEVIVDIEEIHKQAILQQESTYTDPATGFMVFTEFAHLKRGKCCGNQCRHCPYGWSNVRTGEGFVTNGNKKVRSGDRAETRRLVKKILDGTYYDDEKDPKAKSDCTESCESDDASNTETKENPQNNAEVQTSNVTIHSRGKGGRAGGTLTSKNVPYTRKGDAGTSQLFTGERRLKNDVLFEALGTVDELCSIVGVVYASLMSSNENSLSTRSSSSSTKEDSATNLGPISDNSIYGELPEQLLEVMSRLFDIGSHIARPEPKNTRNTSNESDSSDSDTSSASANPKQRSNSGFKSQHTDLLEEWIDSMTDDLPELTSFILPTGSTASAHLHVARTVCRRTERRMVPLVQEEGTCDSAALAYVNRLSDYLFTAARYVNYCDGRDEVQYRRERKGAESSEHFQRERVVVKLKD